MWQDLAVAEMAKIRNDVGDVTRSAQAEFHQHGDGRESGRRIEQDAELAEGPGADKADLRGPVCETDEIPRRHGSSTPRSVF